MGPKMKHSAREEMSMMKKTGIRKKNARKATPFSLMKLGNASAATTAYRSSTARHAIDLRKRFITTNNASK